MLLKVPKEKKQSEMLRDALSETHTVLTETLDLGGEAGAAAAATPGGASNNKVIREVAEQLSDRVVDILRAKLDQAF